MTDIEQHAIMMCNCISPRQSPVKDSQPCTIDVNNVAVWLIECTPLSDYDESKSEYGKTEFLLKSIYIFFGALGNLVLVATDAVRSVI